jgi:hypothetical protein
VEVAIGVAVSVESGMGVAVEVYVGVGENQLAGVFVDILIGSSRLSNEAPNDELELL